MFEILTAPSTVFAVRIEGKLDGQEFDQVIHQFEIMLQKEQSFSCYMEIKSLSMSAESLVKDFKYGFSKFGNWSDTMKQIRRIAVVTDEGWVKTVAQMEATLFQLNMKVFPFYQKEEAFVWASELPSKLSSS